MWRKLNHKNVLEFLGVHLMIGGNAQVELGIVTPFCMNGASNKFFERNMGFTVSKRLDFVRMASFDVILLMCFKKATDFSGCNGISS